MSGAMENRAAVFTSSSQDVEVYLAGGWWPGSLLGWRHETDGSCQVWVRAVVAGVERTTWTDLVDVRLPERPALRTVALASPSVDAGPPSGRDELTSTISLFAVRDGAGGAARDRGTGRAADPATVAGGLRAEGQRPGGRRRAPETQEGPAWAAPGRAAATPAPSGRHRAPAPVEDVDAVAAGRHRAADTGVLPAIGADGGVAAGPRRPSVPQRTRRTDSSWAAGLDGTGRLVPVVPEPAGAGDGAGGEGRFFTRPLRLAGSVPQPRTPHWDD